MTNHQCSDNTDSVNGTSIFHLNVQCMRNKFEEIEMLLCDYKFDFVCINEHWFLKDEIVFYNPEHYNLVDSFSRKEMIHGGVAIYALNKYNCKLISKISELSAELHCELAAIVCNDFQIVTVYRSPNGDLNIFLETMSDVLNIISNKNKKTIITGDFNVHFNTENKNTMSLLNLFYSFGFSAVNSAPTRYSNCLDNVFINFDKKFIVTRTLDTRLSDHLGINISVKNVRASSNQEKICFRPITDVGLHNLHVHLQSINWRFIKDESFNVHIKFEKFTSIITGAIESSFPLKSKLINKNGKKPNIRWFTDDLKQKRETLHFLYDVYKINPSDKLKKLINSTKINYKRNINQAKKTAHDNFITQSSNKNKAMWQIVNNYKVNEQNNTGAISPNEFNNYFTNIATELINALPVSNSTPVEHVKKLNFNHKTNGFHFHTVSYVQVLDIINNLKKTKSRDIYDIDIDILNCIKFIILIPLTNLINLCIINNVFPDVLKLARVVPIHKKGSTDIPANFRPISIIPIFAKIFEIVIKQQVTNHLEINKLFSDCQFGFRSNKSTTCAINKFTDFVNEGLEKGEFIYTQFLDLTKAFDCVSHEILLDKLTQYDFSSNSLNLIKSYLTNRYQIVSLKDNKSESLNITCGVPQGSALGPVLFLIYINDICTISQNVDFVLFADDSTIISRNKDIVDLLLDVSVTNLLMHDWFAANKLTLNVAKTENMIFSLRKLNDNIANTNATNDCVKFLGVFVDNKLTWEKHTNAVCINVSRGMFLLRKLVNQVSEMTLVTAYFGLIHSKISYAIFVWGHSAHSSSVFASQRKAIRIISQLSYRSDCKEVFKKFKILTVPCIYILQCLLHIKTNILQYTKHADVHNYATRNNENLNLEYLRLNKTKNGVNYYSVKFYNHLPIEVRNMDFKLFKTTVKHFLLDNAFYSYDEFLHTKFEI